MLTVGVPVIYTLVLWWFSTGAVLYVIGRHISTYASSMVMATGLAALAIYGLAMSAEDASVAGAFIAFSSSLVIWGWHEMSFLTGYITGPRTTPLPEGAVGSARLLPAIETLIYHELALFVTLAGLAAALLGSANEIGLWTFAILWVMRLSAKLNVFLGVSNLTEQFLPDHLRYLKTYFRHRPMNLLFPVSVTASSAALALLIAAAADPAASDFETCGYTFLATLMALAVLEHWFLVLPIPAEALWTWGLASRTPREATRHSERPSRDPPGERAAPAPVAL